VLDHFDILPLVGTFGVSRWWDIAGLLVLVPITIQVFRAMCSTDLDVSLLITAFFLGWLAGVICFFWKGCLSGFIAIPIGFLATFGIYYLFIGLGRVLEYFFEKCGWWFLGEKHSECRRY